MTQKRNVKQSFSMGRLIFLLLGFLAIDVLILGWSNFSFDTARWLLIFVLDSFLLMSGLLMVFLWRRNSIELVKGERSDEETEMATIILDRLNQYARKEEREKAGL